jgi:hypothetical protein
MRNPALDVSTSLAVSRKMTATRNGMSENAAAR